MHQRSLYLLLLSLVLIVINCTKDFSTLSDDEKPYIGIPLVSIVYPANNSEFPEDTVITIKADASDNESVKEVKFYINGELEYTDYMDPYEYEWDVYSKAGNYTIQVNAYDVNNNIGTSEVIFISIIEAFLTDIDGNVYQIVKIGNQWWMAENLKVTHYRNGDAIPNVTNADQWIELATGAYCNYNNDTIHVASYGRLYNWYAVKDSRNIAPEGWHVPTDIWTDDWNELEMDLGMSQTQAGLSMWRGRDEGGKLKEQGTAHWNSPNTGATDSSGFSALPGGYRDVRGAGDYYYNMGFYSAFWTSAEYDSNLAWSRWLAYSRSQVYRGYDDKRLGYSIRCVRD